MPQVFGSCSRLNRKVKNEIANCVLIGWPIVLFGLNKSG